MKRGKYKTKESRPHNEEIIKSRIERHSLDAQWRGLTNTEKQEVLDIYFVLAKN